MTAPLSPNSLRRGNALWHRNGSITVLEVKNDQEVQGDKIEQDRGKKQPIKKISWPVMKSELTTILLDTKPLTSAEEVKTKEHAPHMIAVRNFALKGRKVINSGDSHIDLEESNLPDFHWYNN